MDTTINYKQYIRRGIDENDHQANMTLLHQALRFTMFGIYSILLIMILYYFLDKNKRKYPYLNLTFIILISVFSSLFSMLTFVLKESTSDPLNGLYYRIGFLFYMLSESCTWLFFFEPLRRYIIANMNHHEEKKKKIIQWWWSSHYKYFLSSFSGILLFISYLYFIGIMVLSCFYVLTFEYINNSSMLVMMNGWVNTNILVVKLIYHGMWYFVLVWFYVLFWNRMKINHVDHHHHHYYSYFLCGCLMVFTQIGITVIIESISSSRFVPLFFIWHTTPSTTWITVIYFCLDFCCHFITLLISMIWGPNWITFIKYNKLIISDENYKEDHV